MADELIPEEVPVEIPAETPIDVVPIEEPIVDVEPTLDPLDIVLVASSENGTLVSNLGRLLWVSPNGTRTIIAGA